jgi:hypothetical protein
MAIVMTAGRLFDFLSKISDALSVSRNLPGYLGMILSGKLSMSMISLLAAEQLNPRLQIPALLRNALKIIAVNIIQKKVNIQI